MASTSSRADEVLQFTERAVSNDIRKVLASAVANAIDNDGQDAEDLYVRACFADEGPTLKRFRPRARGRAARIRKRTCHITVIVDVMTDSMQARRSTKENARAASGKAVGSPARRLLAAPVSSAAVRPQPASRASAEAIVANSSQTLSRQ